MDDSCIDFALYFEHVFNEPPKKRFVLPKIYFLVWLWLIGAISITNLRMAAVQLRGE